MIRPFSQCFGQAGDAKELVLTACMCTRLSILNVMLESGTL